MQVDPKEIEALTREAQQYLAVGMFDRVRLVNEQLELRGADQVNVPKPTSADRQKRTSSQAASRAKRSAN